MPHPSMDSIAEALSEVLREALLEGQPVEVPGLGTFEVMHQPSQLMEEGGVSVVLPPRDVVTFKPAH